MDQARAALRHCLSGLTADDRFALISFATTVETYRDTLVPANDEHLPRAEGWVNGLYAGGGTAIHDALASAMAMRSEDDQRMFTVVFFTDGQPTIGEKDPEKILEDIVAKNTDNTRIFSFGVGDDLNAVFLDQIAEKTRAVNRFVRPGESLKGKVASFFDKINHPVLANLKLSTKGEVRLQEVYPPQLPDLFHGDQLVVLARYEGNDPTDIVLDGKIGIHDKQFVYQVDFAAKGEDKPFVEELWARRKVGYLLDQIRIGGEAQELVDEVVRLAKAYGITTPYTSYLIMPDAPVQLASADAYGAQSGRQGGSQGGGQGSAPAALAPRDGQAQQQPLEEFAKRALEGERDLSTNRGRFQEDDFDRVRRTYSDASATGTTTRAESEAFAQLEKAKKLKSSLDMANENFRNGRWRANQVRKLGVELAISTNDLKNQSQLQATAIRKVNARTCMEFGGVWIDEAFTSTTPTLAIQAQSEAYFRILERQPKMKSVYTLGNHVVWITPSGAALVIDTTDGQQKLDDRDIDALFVAKN